MGDCRSSLSVVITVTPFPKALSEISVIFSLIITVFAPTDFAILTPFISVTGLPLICDGNFSVPLKTNPPMTLDVG